ncbi:MAG: caspase family protein, partial [Bacteroidota bacterium]
LGFTPGLDDAEPDGSDEALSVWADPASRDRASDARGALILDDEIGAWTDRLGAERVLVVLDACHSGTGARGRREGAPPVKEVHADSLSLDPAAPWAAARAAAPPEASGARTVLLAASRAREQAYAGLDGEPSLFTRVLTEVLMEAPADWPLADAMASVRGHVESVSRGYGQMHSPRLEGGGALALADLLAPEAEPPLEDPAPFD